MDGVDRPTQQELLRIAQDPAFAQEAVERWGMDVLMHPVEPCHGCEKQRGVGLGDLVARATSALGVKPCSPCEERRRKLNRWRLGG